MTYKQFAPGLWRGAMPEAGRDLESFKRVICLQDTSIEALYVQRERAWCENLGIEFLHIPMSLIVPPCPLSLSKTAVDLFAPGSSTLVHCSQGVDRTGLVVAHYRRKFQSWTLGQALGEAIDEGFHLDRYCWWLPIVSGYL